MDAIAATYVRLVLAMHPFDADYVDAYIGPASWREAPPIETTLDGIAARAETLMQELKTLGHAGGPATAATAATAATTTAATKEDVMRTDETTIARLRGTFLYMQLRAVGAYAKLLAERASSAARPLPFDQESDLLYGARAPKHDEAYYDAILADLEQQLPGLGTLMERYSAFKTRFAIPPERLDTVFRAAVAETRRRTLERIQLPEEESFVIEYVTDKPWSGYNYYKGQYHSVIQINVSLPVFIDRAVDLAAHEGYPGHHVYNTLLERQLYRGKGQVEYCVYPLFSPQSLIAEGSANYGINMCFPTVADRVAFEGKVLFPLAGLDPETAGTYYRVEAMVHRLSYAGNEAARRYLDGEIDRDAAVQWLTRYALMAPERAQHRIAFFDKYRSYVINYNLGQDMVGQFIDKFAGPAESSGSSEEGQRRRWDLFEWLLSTPQVPGNLLV